MTTISIEEVKNRLDAGEKINLVDVREPPEHADFNIGGLLLPLGKVQTMQVDDIEDLKNEEVICYCFNRPFCIRACNSELRSKSGWSWQSR